MSDPLAYFILGCVGLVALAAAVIVVTLALWVGRGCVHWLSTAMTRRSLGDGRFRGRWTR